MKSRLMAVDALKIEQALVARRQARATQAIADIQRRSVLKGTDQLSIDEIDQEISNLRQDRRRQRGP